MRLAERVARPTGETLGGYLRGRCDGRDIWLLARGHDHFDNFAEYYRLYPNEDETEDPPCAPIFWGHSRFERALKPLRSVLAPWIDTRATVDKVRERLAARARDLVD